MIQSIKIAKREAETVNVKDPKKKKVEPIVAKNIFDQSTNIVFS